jgi:hypothetical protein
MPRHDPLIKTAGDLEVVVLYEAHDLLAGLISPDYYALGGDPPTEVRFHTAASMWNFYVHVHEFVLEGPNVAVAGVTRPSLLAGLLWLSMRYTAEARHSGLANACASLASWLAAERELKFWCPDVDTEFQFRMTRADLIKFAANFSKHRLLRLNTLLEQLRALTRRAGREVQGTQLVAVREPFVVEVQSRLLYLASWLVELLGGVFSALNTVVVTRSNVERTNDVRKMRMPEGVTSDAICNLYGDTLVFKRYDEERIARFVPRVPDLLKLRY